MFKKTLQLAVRLNKLVLFMEKCAVCFLLFSMAALSVFQIILRNTDAGGIGRIDLILRLSVLWIAFIGGSLAFEHKRHIRIDLLHNILNKGKAGKYVSILAEGVSFIVCLLLFMAAADYIHLAVTGNRATFFPGIADWWFRLVIPYSFLAMTVRAGLNLIGLFAPSLVSAGEGGSK